MKEHHDTVARWAFKNVILLNTATNYRQLVPQNHFIALYNSSIPKNVFIDFSFCKNNSTMYSNVDGLLVGHASLVSGEFNAILKVVDMKK
jgi:hypothetical protein